PHLSIGAPAEALGSLGVLAVIPPAIAISLVVVLAYAWLRRRGWKVQARAAPGENELLRLYEKVQRRLRRRRAPPETPLEREQEHARAFEAKYKGNVATLDPPAFAAMMRELAEYEESASKPEVYAYMLHSQDTQEHTAGRLLARVREAGAERGSHMVFFALELAQITDQQAAKLYADPAAAIHRHT